MSKWLLGAALITGLGCGSAYADRIARPAPRGTPLALAVAPAKVRAPYDVTVLREDGEALETYAKGGRYYVLGDDGDRYLIRVTSPTANRVEAVVTVDGLDVIDGESGDLRKRGYVVPPYGDVRIEGFRTSTEDVATFRFSSVDDSYAGKKGKARNVGVIAVAIFEEQHEVDNQQIIVGPTPPPPPPGYRPPYDYRDDVEGKAESTTRNNKDADRRVSKADKAPAKEKRAQPPAQQTAPAPSAPGRGNYGGAAGGAPRTAEIQ